MENQENEESEILIDNYEHVIITSESNDGGDVVLLYTPVNIPGPGSDPILFEESFQGCSCCSSICSSLNCSCLVNGTRNYSASTFRLLSSSTATSTVIYECHENCSCTPSDCGNRLVSRGPHPDLELFQTSHKGYGIRCKKDLLEGSFVCEYAGEVIGSEEVRRRFQLRRGQSNYIFCLREHFGESVLKETWIDPTWIGNVGRYLNHCCEPNLRIVPVRVGIQVPKICLFARQFIAAGTELTFDYGGEEDGGGAGGCVDDAKCVCRCGADKCRGYLPFDDSLF